MEKREAILKSAEKLFAEKGFKATNVAAVMEKANLGTGTFYNYFPSKEALFMEIFMEENVKLKKQIMRETDLNGDPFEVMGHLMTLNATGMTENPILKEWYNREIFSKIEKKYKESKGIDHFDFMFDTFVEVVKKWQETGKMRKDISAEMIMAIFSALISIDTHKEEIGFQYFPEIVQYMSEFVMQGLLAKNE